ncbi:zinc-dependent alcohol dehydrogenase family protein [Kutzneria albida]|uniref:Mycothiol-dependent formaldehyde dehydrogenase n=1 Tax=Kutzneria albida DSM 43870 TaxID=1449976 RepID=W5W7E7_9PSEU|nr:zinc-dependent alcohol dehydrogenase family protein [Kutzneria albida]AHH96630.1 mycothiol-dependent formaldehyde dehydrogenase [Kutzneria albida DSM 43870]
MRAVVYEQFGAMPEVREVADPAPARDGVVIGVEATGLCRSDWHGWQGHDSDIRVLPHVPGHELAGVVQAVGAEVTQWRAGDRVTVPFISACGRCASCAAGDQQVCQRQTQPGFTHWGSFAEFVAVDHAEVNLVRLPEDMRYSTAAALGCRFATAFRAVVAHGRVEPGQWVAVHGCGGVGLSAVMIAAAAGARVVAVDLSPGALALAAEFGAEVCVDGGAVADVPAAIVSATDGGAHVSLDALGSPATCAASILGLRRRGRHVQVGLLPPAAGPAVLPMERVIGWELQVLGSHGMAAHAYPSMIGMVGAGTLRPDRLIARTIGLAEAGPALATMHTAPPTGMTMISPRGAA